MIFEAKLSPKAGYAEVEVNGERTYRNTETGVLIEDEIPTPTTDEILLELAADHEARICEIELGVN